MDKKDLIVFEGPPKEQRLNERAKIVAKNFSDTEYGLKLMDFMLIAIYNKFSSGEDFYSEQVCANIHQARSYLEFFLEDVD